MTTEVGYRHLLDKVMRGEVGRSDTALSYEWANMAFEHPDFDIPDVMAVTVGRRTLLIVEGERENVYPIIEKANEIMEKLR